MAEEQGAVGGVAAGGEAGAAPAVRRPTEEEERSKRTCGARAEADRAALVFQFPFLAQLAIHLELVPVVDCRIPTAATDGHTIWLNPRFFAGLADSERLFVLGHEVWHCALGHIGRAGGRDHERWNAAIDHEVNALLVAEKLQMPRDGILFEGCEGLPAEEVYELLGLWPDEEKGREGGEGSDVSGEDEGEVDREGEVEDEDEGSGDREGEVDDGNESENEGRDGSEGEGDDDYYQEPDSWGPFGPMADLFGDLPPHVQPRSHRADVHEPGLELPDARDLVVDPDYSPALHPLDDAVWKERLVAAAQRAPGAARAMGGALLPYLEPLTNPTVPWQEVLRRFVTSAYGGERRWLPPNRRYVSRGLYLPSRRAEKIQLVVVVDTSVSTAEDLPQFAGELIGLVESFGAYELTVLCCDDAIRSVETYSPDRPLTVDDLRFVGGNGTDLRPPFEWFEREAPDADVLLYLTDGWGDAPQHQPPIPTLWVLTDQGTVPAPWGEVCWLGKRDADAKKGRRWR